MAVEKGSVSGRFFAFSGADGLDLVQVVRDLPAPPMAEERYSFCSQSGGPVVTEDDHPLAYRPLPGPTLLWLRREVRRPSKTILDEECERRSSPLPFRALRPVDKDKVRAQARNAVVSAMTPVVSVIPVAVVGSALWVGSKLACPGDGLTEALARVLGRERVSRAFAYEPHGFQVLSTSACHMAVKGSDLPFSVDEVSATVGSGRLSGSLQSIREPLATSMTNSDVVFRSITVSRRLSGATVSVSLDSDGPYRVDLPDSPGGIPEQRVIRRLVDAQEIVGGLLVMMQECATRLASELDQ